MTHLFDFLDFSKIRTYPDVSVAEDGSASAQVTVSLTSTGQSSVDFAQVAKTQRFEHDLQAIKEISKLAAASR